MVGLQRQETGMSIVPQQSGVAPDPHDRSVFPGWRWVMVALAFPPVGLIGWAISGPVDGVGPALIGGLLTGAGLGAVAWWAADGAFGAPGAWIAASAAGYSVGLAAGAAAVGYDTDVGSLAAMGFISGAALGLAQGAALLEQGERRLAAAWAAAMPVLFALGWCASSAIGISVEDQFTVFGAAGAIVFMLLSGLLLARLAPARTGLA
jgi:hypothetical protein